MALTIGAAFAADRASADAYLANVPNLIKENNYKTIEDMSKRALQSDDTCPNAHFYMGMCLEKNGKSREAFKEYQTAATLATKEKDTVTAAKASAAGKRVGMGLIELDALDAKLAEKMHKLADEAADAGQLDTAKQAYGSVLVLQPDNAKAKDGLEKVMAALAERGDPVKSKIASATASEMWYKLGIGQKDEAKEKAKELSEKYGDTEFGKEAAGLLERDFAPPKKEEIAKASEKLKKQNAKVAVAKPAPPSPTPGPGTSPSVPPKPPANTGPKSGVDVAAVEKAAEADAKKMSKDALVPAFKDACTKGKSFYQNATPGSENNQINVAKALEQFIRADALYGRIETENLSTPELAAMIKESSMLHYACLKMTILAH